MRVLVQRSRHSSVSVNNKIVGEIDKGLVLFVGFTHNDTVKEIDYLINKIVNLRIFDDENGVMNKSVLDTNGSVLSISQFTLYADTKKGHRPSYLESLTKEEATILYDTFNERLSDKIHLEKGIFHADMLVNINNDGPVTIMLDSANYNIK